MIIVWISDEWYNNCMSKEFYIGLALAFAGVIVAVIQMVYSAIPYMVGWPIVGVLAIAAFIFLFVGIRKKGQKRLNTKRQTDILSVLRAPISDVDKQKISSLMETVNLLINKMERIVDESRNFNGDRAKHYKEMLDQPEIKRLQEKCIAENAQVRLISPELSRLIEDLIKFIQTFNPYFLREWHANEVFILQSRVAEYVTCVQTLKDRIRKAQEKLLK